MNWSGTYRSYDIWIASTRSLQPPTTTREANSATVKQIVYALDNSSRTLREKHMKSELDYPILISYQK